MVTVPPIQGKCDCCGTEALVQANFIESREAYDNRDNPDDGIPYEEGLQNFSACHQCFVGGNSAQFDEWTEQEKIHFWNTGQYLKKEEEQK